MGSQMGKGKRASAAGHAAVPAAWLGAVVSPDPDLCSERAGSLLLDQVIQRGRCAAQALQGQEAVRQETQARMVVEARPGASLEVVQAQLLFELLIALLYVPARLPQFDRVHQRRLSRQVGQGVADGAIDAPFDEQPARLSLQIGQVIGGPPVLPAVGWPHAHPCELGVQRPFGSLPPAERRALEGLRQLLDGHWRRRVDGHVAACRRAPALSLRPDCPAGRLAEDGFLASDADDILFMAVFQAAAEVHTQAVAGIRDYRLMRQSFSAHLVEQVQGNLTFGAGHLRFGWYPHRLHAHWLARPRLRQIQAQRKGVVAHGCGVVQRDRHLAVVRFAQRAGVLARDTHGVTALLGKAGVVDHDHSSRIGQPLRQQLAIRAQYRLLVPAALIDKQLQRLLGITVPAPNAAARTQRLDALALTVQKQTLDIDLCPMAAGDNPKLGSEQGDVLLDSLENVRVQLHHRYAPHTATLQFDRKAPVDRLASRRRHKYYITTQ